MSSLRYNDVIIIWLRLFSSHKFSYLLTLTHASIVHLCILLYLNQIPRNQDHNWFYTEQKRFYSDFATVMHIDTIL